MNKRIKKKRRKLHDVYIGDHIYTHEELKIHHMEPKPEFVMSDTSGKTITNKSIYQSSKFVD